MHTSDSMLNQWVIIHVTPHGGVYNNIRAGACLLSNCRLGTKNRRVCALVYCAAETALHGRGRFGNAAIRGGRAGRNQLRLELVE